jgi:hypothetical protein
MALFAALKNYAKPHAKAVFFTRAVGGMRWRNNMEINAESGYARVLTDHQNSDCKWALSTAGWKKYRLYTRRTR